VPLLLAALAACQTAGPPLDVVEQVDLEQRVILLAAAAAP
jgi:hypothetical protein